MLRFTSSTRAISSLSSIINTRVSTGLHLANSHKINNGTSSSISISGSSMSNSNTAMLANLFSTTTLASQEQGKGTNITQNSKSTSTSKLEQATLTPPKDLQSYAALNSKDVVQLVTQNISSIYNPPTFKPATAQQPLKPLFSKEMNPHTFAPTETLTPSPVFAVVYIGGTQYKVTKNDVLVVNKLDCKVGSKIVLEKVLLLGSHDFTIIGTPLVSKKLVRVEATVIEQGRSGKVIVFKKKRRKQYKKWKGFRQEITTLRINKLEIFSEALSKAPLTSAEIEKEKAAV